MLKETQQNFHREIKKFARKNIIKKLEDQGIDYHQLDDNAFNELVANEIEILKADTKKVGVGIGLGILFSLVTGI